MPLVTITHAQGTSTADRRIAGDVVNEALTQVGVPPTDRFQRYLDLAPDRLVVDPTYPNLTEPRSNRFVLIEILWSVGRNVKLKKQVAHHIATELSRRTGIAPRDVFIVFTETAWENWAFASGELLHA
jgi:phenylpyruvate tautomerase PptA (4-oxalocrotonate tautomerase family)